MLRMRLLRHLFLPTPISPVSSGPWSRGICLFCQVSPADKICPRVFVAAPGSLRLSPPVPPFTVVGHGRLTGRRQAGTWWQVVEVGRRSTRLRTRSNIHRHQRQRDRRQTPKHQTLLGVMWILGSLCNDIGRMPHVNVT